MNPPRQPAAPGPRRRAWARRAWSAYVGCLLGAGGAAALVTLGVVPVVVGLPFATLTAGVTAFTFLGDDRAAFVRGQVIGFKIALCGLAALGLFLAIGPWTYPLVAVAALASPASLRLVARWRGRSTAPGRPAAPPPPVRPPAGCTPLDRSPTLDMSAFEVALLDADDDETGGRPATTSTQPPAPSPLGDLSLDDLCRVWRRSYVLLQQDLPPDAALEVLAARERCLTEFELRCPDGVRAWLRSPAGASSDPRAYLLGSESP